MGATTISARPSAPRGIASSSASNTSSSRLQLQERLARDIVQMLSEALNNEALGFAIVMKGQHLCKTMRGVRNDGKMSVAHFTGVFNLNSDLRKEFYKLIDLNSNG